MSAPKTVLGGEDVHAIVIDCGSWNMRIGSAGDDSPRSIIPAAVGIKGTSSTPNVAGGDVTMTDVTTGTTTSPSSKAAPNTTSSMVAGDSIFSSAHLMHDVNTVYSLDSTTGDATVQNWDAMEAVWRAGLNALHLEKVARSAPLMIVEPTRMWSDSERAKALQRAFEGLQVPAAYIGRGAAMAAFSSAKPTACVLDIGAQGATAVPVIDGYVLRKTTRRSVIGGAELSIKLKEWAESCLETRPGYDGRERSPGKRARKEQYLRAHHELNRQRIFDNIDDARTADTPGDGKIVKRRYKVTDISDPSRYTESHRDFYRLRLIDELKASLLQVDTSKPTEDENGSKGNGSTSGNKKGGESSAKSDEKDDKDKEKEKEKDSNGANNNSTNNTNSNSQNNKDKGKDQKQSSTSESNAVYTLPDGNELSLSEKDGAAIGDLLFTTRPESRICSVTELVLNSIGASDVDNRRDLFGGVVVVGGSSVIPGCVERLARELALKIPQAYKLKLHAASNNTERTCAGWIGGSIVASLGTFQQAWISREEYDELGAHGALRKCP